MNKQFFSYGFLAAALIISSTATVSAFDFSISNNGSGTRNSIRTRISKKSSTLQQNSISNFNSISVSSNTGGNTTNDNTGGGVEVKTGSTDSTVTIFNSGGYNYSHSSTCCGWECDDPDPSPTPTPTASPTPSPTPNTCQEGPGWSATVVEANQGTLKSGAAITDTSRTNPDNATGAVDGDFFSLGKDGSIVLAFAQPVANVTGDDLSFHEVTTNRGAYPEEKMMVEVSQNGTTWFDIGDVTNNDGGNGVGYLDFDSTGLSTVNYVRLTDSTDYDLHDDQADGYDLEAVDATNLMCE